MPKVSVIIPTFNRSQYVCEAIDSVLAQTYKDYEIIVIDDGSTDDTMDVLKRYGEKIRYFYQENCGSGEARNSAIFKSRGEYVAFLDDDDMWLQNKLEKQVCVLDKYPDIAFACSATYVIDNVGKVVKVWGKGIYNYETFNSLYEADFAYTLTVITRRKCLDDVGFFDVSLSLSQDYDLWLRLAKKYKFKYIDIPLAKYRLHNTNISKDYDLRLKQHIIIANKPEIAKDMGWLRKRIRLAKDHYLFGSHYYSDRNFYKAGGNFLKAVLAFPFIGYYYWPEETKNLKFSLPYRILKAYLIVPICFLKSLTYRFAPRLITKKESILSK